MVPVAGLTVTQVGTEPFVPATTCAANLTAAPDTDRIVAFWGAGASLPATAEKVFNAIQAKRDAEPKQITA